MIPRASTRHTVVSVRLDTDAINAVDVLVDSGLANSRSEAVAMLVMRGMYRSQELMSHARELAKRARRLKAAEVGPGHGSGRPLPAEHPIWTELQLAVMSFQTTRIAPLLDAGEDLEARSKDAAQQTALHIAVSARLWTMIKCLLEHGADPNATDSKGWTALHYAAHNGDYSTASLLLHYGGDRTVIDHSGHSPGALAEANGYAQLAQMLVGDPAPEPEPATPQPRPADDLPPEPRPAHE